MPSRPVGPTDAGSRIALRNWRISTRLVSLLALPVVAATTLGGLRINDSLNDIQQLDHMQLLTDMTKEATDLATQLQAERDSSAGPLTNGVSPNSLQIKSYRDSTDRAKKAFLDAADSIRSDNSDQALDSIQTDVDQIATQVNTISSIRQNAFADSDESSSLTIDQYDVLINSLLSLSQDMAQATNNSDMIKRTRALSAFSTAKEYASVQRAVIAAALPADPKHGHANLSTNDRLYGANASTKEKNALSSFSSLYESLGGNAEQLLAPLQGEGSPEIQAAQQYEARVLGSPDGLKNQPVRSYADWVDQASVEFNTMKTIEQTLLGQVETQADELRQQSQRDAIINGALILLVLGVSLVGAFIVSRSMIRSLRRLQDTASRVARDRLPELVKELSESDPQDVDTSVESVGVHSRDEIGQVAEAFDHVHREAVRLAAEQALLRGNVNAMFTNLSRRSQGLIQRQLSLISELESREADPDQLSSLFKLDHLATRMRRNGENLLVLAGEEPGRRWTRPVPLVDVLRAAASEVEQYERIELAAVPATEVAGRVVNDLVHLLAELLENATSFSSPQTKVRVTGHALPDGRVLVEIHDTGIGLSPEDLASINERLASPPTVDVSVSRRMGLFVVGRLSLRHGIRIQLRPSDSGGTTALVMLPVDVAHGGKRPAGKPGQPGARPPGSGAPRAGLSTGPGGGLAGLGTRGGKGGGGGSRGQVGAGAAPRAALPSRDTAGAGAQGARAERQDQNPADTASFRSPFAAEAGRGAQARPDQERGSDRRGGLRGGRQNTGAETDARTAEAPRDAEERDGAVRQQPQRRGAAGNTGAGRGRQLTPPGAPRAELPGGPGAKTREEQPKLELRPSLDAPRGHDEQRPDSGENPRLARRAAAHQQQQQQQQNPAATQEFERPDFGAPRSDFQVPDREFDAPRSVAGPVQNVNGPRGRQQDSGQDRQDPAGTQQFARPDFDQPRPDAGRQQDFGAQRPGFNGQRPGPEYGGGQQQPQQPPYGGRPDYGPQGGYRGGQEQWAGNGNGYAPQNDYGQGAPYQNQGQGQNQGGMNGRPDYAGDQASYRGQDYANGQQAGQGYVPQQGAPQQGYQDPQGYAPQQGYQQRPPAPAPGYAQRPDQQQGGFAGPQQRQPEALPPAPGPGDGRTPLYDTLETNWFGGGRDGGAEGAEPVPGRPQGGERAGNAQEPERTSMPRRDPGAGLRHDGAPAGGSTGASDQFFGNRTARNASPAVGEQNMSVTDSGSWRTSPNDELVRQAERTRKPAAGGITTSGLPRRVPQANLVPGMAQEQTDQSGPQVSRAPADVRGRLTNLRRGIQQGRRAGTGPANSGFNFGPSHQQER